jgi:hypothetical protein
MALFILGNTWPNVAARTITYMAAHLADKEDTASEVGGIIWTLLRTGTESIIRDVVAFVRLKTNMMSQNHY